MFIRNLQLTFLLLSVVTYLISAEGMKKSNETAKTTTYFKSDIFGRGTYAFGYEINDKENENLQFRDEKRFLNSTVIGSYGHLQPDGRITVTHYVADNETGYHSTLDTYEPEGSDSLKFSNMSVEANKLILPKKTSAPNITDNLLQKLDINSNITVLPDVNVDPLIHSILNGSNKNQTIELTTVRNLLPTNFPIVPFLLPQDNLTIMAPKTTRPTTTPLVASVTLKSDENSIPWYEKIIQQNRKEFLENLPNLN